MKKIVISIALFIIIFVGISLISSLLLGDKEAQEFTTSYTEAICNETNYCQDYEVYCREEEFVKMSPLTGAVVQHSEDWKDPRDKKTIEELCQ